MRFLAILLLLAGPAAAQAPWPAVQYNPKPLAEDLLLPMPCGGQMAFRRVVVPSKDLLDDYRIQVGGVLKEQAYKENVRADYIAGAFTEAGRPGERSFWVGKYPVTRQQFAALRTPCPPADEDGRLPQTAITWLQAMGFADALTGWLLANGRKILPVEAGQPGFLRLPSEAEWEFAARGGARVSVAEFAAPLPPMTGPLSRYAWYGGTDSSNDELQPVGLLEPNPLGLFDMLGNAGQFAFDLFRLNHLSRMHGEAGGFVVRGGNYTNPASQIRSAAREEFAPYDASGPRRQKTVGFRLVLVAPVLPTVARVRELSAAWHSQTDTSGGALPDVRPDDPVAELEALSKAVDDSRLKQRLQELSVVMAINIKTRNEQRDRAARNNLDLATWLVAKLQVDTRRLVGREQVAILGGGAPNDATQALIRNDTSELQATIKYYRDTLQTIGAEYPQSVRDAQAMVLKTELEERKAAQQAQLVQTVQDDIAATRREGGLAADALEARLRRNLCQTPAGGRVFAEACQANRK